MLLSGISQASPEDDWMALSAAAQKGDLKAVGQMLKRGVKPDAPHPDHENVDSAMDWAAIHGDVALIRLLISYHADVNAHENIGDLTPLMFAAENGKLAAAQELILHGAKPNLKDTGGSTALDHALHDNDAAHQKVAVLLRQHGAVVGAKPASQPQAAADDPCGGIVQLAEMGPKGYAALAGPPFPQDTLEGMLGEKEAKMSLGPAACTVNDDDSDFSCGWKGEIGFSDLVPLVKQCLKPKTVEVSDESGKSTVWYGNGDERVMVEIYEKGPSIKFVGTSPHHLKPTFEIQNWTNEGVRVAIDGTDRCTIAPAVTADGYMSGTNCNLDIPQGTYTLAVTRPGGAILQQVFTYNGSNCVKVLDSGLSFKDGMACVFAPGKDGQ